MELFCIHQLIVIMFLCRFEPNVIPHHSIIRAIGMIAGKHSVGMLPFIKVTLSVLVPLLPDMNEEQLKLASVFSGFLYFSLVYLFVITRE